MKDFSCPLLDKTRLCAQLLSMYKNSVSKALRIPSHRTSSFGNLRK